MLEDMENGLVELKKMVDNCLTHTNLCDNPPPSVTLGEHLQLALNSHDGSMFLEQPNHIPEEYHKYFGIQPIISSPRSESNTLVTNPEDDENSNSMMSANSEKEGLGAQMVLEQNLGVCGQHDDEDELDEDSNSKSKRDRHESSNSKMDSFVIVDDSNSELKKSTKNNENISDSVVVTTTTAAVNVTHQNNVQHRTRLPSFSSIIAGSPKSELQDICLVSDPEQAQQVVPEDHHSNPTNSRRGSIENPDVRPSLDIRRCSLDQTFSALNPNTDSLHNARRASIDNGLIINNIRSTLDQTGYHAVDSYGHQAGDMLPVNLDPECSFSASVVTSAPVASMSIAPVDSTHVTYSQQLASGVQSLPPSGPPSVQADPRHNSMPSSPLSNQPAPPPTQNQNSSNFPFSELESVLGSVIQENGDLQLHHFTTPSPEKLLQSSIPPSSMMMNSDQDPCTAEKIASKKTGQRTDFLGALKESNSNQAAASQETAKSDQNKTEEAASPPPPLTVTFDDGQTNSLIRSTLADVTHPVSFSNTTLSEPAKSTDRDSLSQLFEEINDVQEAQAQDPK